MNLTDQHNHIIRLTNAARSLVWAIEQGRNPENEIRKLKRVIRRGRVKPRRGVELSDLVAALEAVKRIDFITNKK